MPSPEDDIKRVPSSPSIALQLHQEFAVFRSTLLTDVKSLLQAALQEVLDQHGVLLQGQDEKIQKFLTDASSRLQADYWGAEAGGAEATASGEAVPAPVTQGLILDVSEQAVSALQGTPEPPPEAPPAPGAPGKTPYEQHLRSRRAAHAYGEIIVEQPGPELPPELIPNAEKIDPFGVNRRMALFCDARHLSTAEPHKEPYDVRWLYDSEGYFPLIALNDNFKYVTGFFLLAQAVWLAADADSQKDSAALEAFEHLFCIYFLLEIAIRFLAFAEKPNCLKDFCFKFDAALVVMMVLESWFLPIFFAAGVDADRNDPFMQIVRIARIARMVRIARALPQIMTLVRGAQHACYALLATLLTLFILVYTFGIVLHILLQDEPVFAKSCSSFLDTMLTLVLHGVFLDHASDFTRALLNGDHVVALFFFACFTCISATLVMHVLIGVLVETTRQLTSFEKDAVVWCKLRNKLLSMFKEIDTTETGEITKEQLISVLCDQEVAAMLNDLKVDIPHLLELQEMLYSDPEHVLQTSQILNMIMEMRGDRSSTMQDLINGHTFTRWAIDNQLNYQTVQLKEYMEQIMAMSNNVSRSSWYTKPLGQSMATTDDAGRLLQTLSGWMTPAKENSV